MKTKTKRRNVLIDGMKDAMFEMLRFRDILSRLEDAICENEEDADFDEEKEKFAREVAEVKYVKKLAESVTSDLEKFCKNEISWSEVIYRIQLYDKDIFDALECLDMHGILKKYNNQK